VIDRERIAAALAKLTRACKVHTVRVALSGLSEAAAVVGAAFLVFHKAYAASIAKLTTDIARHPG